MQLDESYASLMKKWQNEGGKKAFLIYCRSINFCHLHHNRIHNRLNGIAGILERNIFCVFILSSVFLPQSAERITFSDLFRYLRIVHQNHAAAAFLCSPFQCTTQCCFAALHSSQHIEDMYIIIVSWTGIRNVTGQHSFQLFRQHCFKVVGQNT